METIILKYIDGVGVTQSQTFNVLYVRGFSNPDVVALVPALQYEFVDGSLQTAFKGFRRVLTIQTDILTSVQARFINAFMQATSRSLVYNDVLVGTEEMFVSVQNMGYEFEWIGDFIAAKSLTLHAVEHVVRTVWTNYTPPSGTDIMYIKKKVEVIGTLASPETFTTNTGKLATMETGAAYPSILLGSWVVTVFGIEYQEATVSQVGNVTQSGSDISFQLAISDVGKASSDTKYYFDIIIGLQTR